MVIKMNEQRDKRLVYGHSFWGAPVVFEKLGSGRTTLLFSGDFAGDPKSAGVIERFCDDLYFCGREDLAPVGKIGIGRLLLVRSVFLVPCPNPDALLIKAGGPGEESPFLPRVKRLLANRPAVLWSANGRGVDVGRNFNYRFAAYKEGAVKEAAPFGYGGSFPESEPESSSFASFARRIAPRLFVHLVHGADGLFFDSGNRALAGICARYAPFEKKEANLSATPEGWLFEELNCAYLRISCGFEEEERTYRLLRPLLFALTAY